MSRYHVVCHDCPLEGLTDCGKFAASVVELHELVRSHSIESEVVTP
jgi:hypothetical protein